MNYIITEQRARCKDLLISRLLSGPHKLQTCMDPCFRLIGLIDELYNYLIVLVTESYRECMGMLITENAWTIYTKLQISRFLKHFH